MGTDKLKTSKVVWDSVLGTVGAMFMGIDTKSFFLETSLERFEYTKIPLSIFPQHVINQYNLSQNAKDGFVYLDIRQAIYGLPQVGALANKLLRKYLAPAGYYKCAHMLGLWRHITRSIQFTLVMGDFGVKYIEKEHAEHLFKAPKKDYKLSKNWEGNLYCGNTVDWNNKEGYLGIPIPGYIMKLLQRVKYERHRKPKHSPYQALSRIFDTGAQNTVPDNKSAKLDEKGSEESNWSSAEFCTMLAQLTSRYFRHEALLRVSNLKRPK